MSLPTKTLTLTAEALVNWEHFNPELRQLLLAVFDWVDSWVAAPKNQTVTLITADGAVDPHTSAIYLFTKAGIAAMTLGAPTSGTDDGVTISFTNTTTDQDTVTATGLFEDGTTTTDKATWPAHPGATLRIIAYGGKWLLLSNNLVVMS